MMAAARSKGFCVVQIAVLVAIACTGVFAADSGSRTREREERQKAKEEERARQRQAEEKRKRDEEEQKIIRKYAAFSTDQLRLKVRSLDGQIAGGWVGTGLGAVIAKSIYDGKVRERDEIAMEILRRTETLDGPAPGQQTTEPGGTPSRSGTGFFISGDGHLITNDHVVRGGRRVRVRTSGGELTATVVRSDEGNDLALLKVEGSHAYLPVRASRTVRLGESVATVGFPNPQLQGFSPKLTRGEISSLAGIQDDPKAFQVSLPVQPGNSGGALVDSNGNVVGVIVARLSQKAALETTGRLAENVNYAIKSSFLLGFLESVPGLAEKISEGQSGARAFEDVVADTEKATALILVE